MKKCYLLFSLLLCLFMTQNGYSQQFDGGYDQDQQWSEGGQPAYAGDYASNNEQCGDQPVGPCVCYCKYCHYKPCYYNVTRCSYEPKYTQKRCCRFVSEAYQKKCVRYVPQCYYKTCYKQVPQYYYTTQCHMVPKYHTERHCKYEPTYYYKRSCIANPNEGQQNNAACDQPCQTGGCQSGPCGY